MKNVILQFFNRSRLLASLLLATFVALVFVLSPAAVDDQKAKRKMTEHKKAYEIHQKKCLGCHDSVADPEKPGRTRDDWHLVINVMHGYGLELTSQENEAITDLLYDLRRGLEKDAG